MRLSPSSVTSSPFTIVRFKVSNLSLEQFCGANVRNGMLSQLGSGLGIHPRAGEICNFPFEFSAEKRKMYIWKEFCHIVYK